jgi:hypothetical protein
MKQDQRSVHCNTGMCIPKLQVFFYIVVKTRFTLRGSGVSYYKGGSKFCLMSIMTRERGHKVFSSVMARFIPITCDKSL